MQLSNYKFGSIEVNGQTHTQDLLIKDDEIILDNWWRIDGHSLHMEDFDKVKEFTPAFLVIGRGHNDVMEISDEMRTKLDQAGFELLDFPTTDAVETFNEMQEKDLTKSLIGGFHLTC